MAKALILPPRRFVSGDAHHAPCPFEMLVLHRLHRSVAHVRGLTNRSVHFGHALVNTLVPVMTIPDCNRRLDRVRHHHRNGVPKWLRYGARCSSKPCSSDIPVRWPLICVSSGLIFVVINPIDPVVDTTRRPRLRIGGGGTEDTDMQDVPKRFFDGDVWWSFATTSSRWSRL